MPYGGRVSGPRRSPSPQERTRDAERTRSALLDAALVEFGAKGLAGARVDVIAARAGVNSQLISYYFGGKQGLYDAILERWYAKERDFDQPGTTLVELVLRYLDAGRTARDLTRMFLRETLDEDPAEAADQPVTDELGRLRARQQAGEIGADLDPAFVLLFLQAMVVSGVLFPGEAKRLTGLDPSSTAFYDRAREQLTKIVERLA
jgi:AcrR family transcriptional regulator